MSNPGGCVAALLFASLLVLCTAWSADELQTAMQAIVEEKAEKYNCSVALGLVQADIAFEVAAGSTDRTTGRSAAPQDLYVWGSITKTFTGPAVLQLVEQGHFRLDDKVSPLVSTILQQLNGTGSSLENHFGSTAGDITVRHLLHMTSGLPDYDTSWVKGDPWRQQQFSHPLHDYGPIETLNRLTGGMLHKPGVMQDYCSTNYIVLGLILAQHYLAGSTMAWPDYDQKTTAIPATMRRQYGFNDTVFVDHGVCATVTQVHGYDMYIDLNHDVWNVSCVGGWTAGNVVSSVKDVARWTHILFGTTNVVSDGMQAQIRNTSVHCGNHVKPGECYGVTNDGYGLASFNLSRSTGAVLPEGESWGHLGSTYGYQSMSNYFPALNLTIVVATNIEIRDQDQPSDTMCSAFNTARRLMRGLPPPTCTFGRSGYFFGNCTCV